MASRVVRRWRAMVGVNRSASPCRGVTTSTPPRMKANAPAISDFTVEPDERRASRRNFVPVYVALGMIALSTSLGLFAAKQQLLYAPNVFVRKKRRETIPELDDPDWAAEKADRFLNRSLFRRLAHLQVFAGISDPLRPDVCPNRPRRVEDLRSSVDPRLHRAGGVK